MLRISTCDHSLLALASVLFMLATSGSAARAASLGIEGSKFTIDGRPTFLLGFSYYGALGAPEELIRQDLDEMQRLGFNWFRVWATWSAYGDPISAVTPEGQPREPYISRLKWLIEEADKHGMIVDVTLSRGDDLPDQPAHLQAVATLAEALKPYRNVYIDLGNERNIRDRRYVSFEDLRELRDRVKEIDPERLLTASHAGDIPEDEIDEYLTAVGVDFIAPHRPRNGGSPGQTEQKTRDYLQWTARAGRLLPVHYQEPFRRDFSKWQPEVEDFITDLRGAVAGGAAGWCFHNGGVRGSDDGRPRRSFDMRPEEGRMLDQLDAVERYFIHKAKRELQP